VRADVRLRDTLMICRFEQWLQGTPGDTSMGPGLQGTQPLSSSAADLRPNHFYIEISNRCGESSFSRRAGGVPIFACRKIREDSAGTQRGCFELDMSHELPLGEAEPPLLARVFSAAPLTLCGTGTLVQPIGCIRGSGLPSRLASAYPRPTAWGRGADLEGWVGIEPTHFPNHPEMGVPRIARPAAPGGELRRGETPAIFPFPRGLTP